mgnify:CR=1 FL=1
MLVWRVECPKGAGPFRRLAIGQSCVDFNATGLSHIRNNGSFPVMQIDWPYNATVDLYSKEAEKYVCGCPDKESLLEWFPKDSLKKLIGLGYRVRVYRPKEYIIGTSGIQVFFKK